MRTNAIWVDTYYETTASTLDFQVEVDGSVVYQGKAVRPNAGTPIRLRVNDICRDFLNPYINFTGNRGTYTAPNAVKDFILKDLEGNELETYRFYWDYSYQDLGDTLGNTISAPVNGHYGYNQFNFDTVSSNDGYTTTVERVQGGYCGEWALYYCNAYGGFDSLLIEGSVQRSDEVENYTSASTFDNNDLGAFGTNRYAVEITPKFVINTGYLTREQGDLIPLHLLPSGQVWLHNFKVDEYWPVVITDTSWDWKTYSKGNMINYRISVEGSQKKTRV